MDEISQNQKLYKCCVYIYLS